MKISMSSRQELPITHFPFRWKRKEKLSRKNLDRQKWVIFVLNILTIIGVKRLLSFQYLSLRLSLVELQTFYQKHGSLTFPSLSIIWRQLCFRTFTCALILPYSNST